MHRPRARPRRVVQGEAAGAEAGVGRREGEGVQGGAHGVGDAERGLAPGGEGEEEGVVREEVGGVLEVGEQGVRVVRAVVVGVGG